MEQFQQTIKTYLDQRAKSDSLFAKNYPQKDKSIADCCNYIISEVRKKKQNTVVMQDDDVYCMAVHFFDEDSIKAPQGEIECEVASPTLEVPPTVVCKTKRTKQAKQSKEPIPGMPYQMSIFDMPNV
ncbi:MAG: Cas9 inhibitor AcrIIA9 family protein [Marinifilaceae bacterium]